MKTMKSSILFWLCLTVVIITPFSNDLFISAFPIMTKVFNTIHTGWVVSCFLIGLAIAQPIYGPISDRFGRKPVLLFGLVIFIVGSILSLSTTNFNMFLLARFIQALGACSTIISGFAMLRDTQHGVKFNHSMAILMAIIGVCPAVAPFCGAILTTTIGWKGSFIFLLLLGIFYLFVISFIFKETQEEKNIKACNVKNIAANYKTLTNNKTYLYFCITSALSYGTLFTYFTLAPIYIIKQFKFSIIDLGWIALIMGFIIFTSSILIPSLSARIGLKKTALFGSTLIFCGAIIMFICIYLLGSNIYTYIFPMVLVILGIGFIRPTASAGAMEQSAKKTSGTAASGFNFFSFIGGSICSALSGYMISSPLKFAIFAIITGLLSISIATLNCKTTT